MKDRLNKPRVFLSHSKKDITFVKRVYDDLRKCQIEPWLDKYEIRHGQPWLDAIFEDGIPTCDAIIVYLTVHSIESPVVKKEIDASILQKLKESQIGFLPYVSSADLRSQLRSDLQTLQTPEWNDANYSDLLPRVASEVWHSYLERTVAQAIQKERIARLEAELQVQELRKRLDDGVFSPSEARDFEYIWGRLDRFEPFVFVRVRPSKDASGISDKYSFLVNVGSLISRLGGSSSHVFHKYEMIQLVRDAVREALPEEGSLSEGERIDHASSPDIGDELLMYGFLVRQRQSREGVPVPLPFAQPGYALMYTEKLERFKYWLAVNQKLPADIQWKTQEQGPADK